MSLGALECDECGYRSKLEHRFVLKAGTMFCYGCYDAMRDTDATPAAPTAESTLDADAEQTLRGWVEQINRNLEAAKEQR